NVSNIVISNNMIYGINTINYSTSSTTYNPFGIRITGGTGHKLYYNSVHLYGSQFASGTVGTLSAALLIISSTATGMDIRDNIFSNGIEGLAGSSSYAVYGVTGVTFGTINFNDYYGFGTYGKLGFLGSEKLTLADWQAATLQDSNSVAGDPKFVSDTDLHILTTATSPVNNAGTPIAGITEDFDGNTRSLTTPDIGADEYTYIPPSVVDPTGVSATAINATQINIAFTANVNNDSVIVVWNNTGTFTTPTGAPPAVGDSLAGGKLLYNGTVSPQSHAGLTPITQYYYKLFSYNGTSYSPGVTATATTPCPVYTLPFSESVNGATFPSCWSQTSTLTGTRWTVSATNNAGGTANEFKGTYVNGTGLTRLITPALNTTGVTALTVNFKHFFDDYAAGINYKVQSSVDGVTWTDETWGGASGGGNVGPADVSFDVTNNLGTTTYIAWVLDGNHFQFDYWYLDNIEIIKKPAIDLALTQLYQFTGLPTPRINEHFTDYTVSLSNKTSKNGEDIATLAAGLSGTKASDANLTGTIVDSKNSLLNNLLSNITVKAQISNLGLNAATYNLNWDVDGVSQTPYNGPSVSPAGKDTAVLTFTPTVRGTFFTNGAIVVTGDEVAGNNSKQFRMRVYPDVFSRKIYDRGDNTVDTYVGWGDTTKPMKAGVRFTADSTVRLAGVDFIYRTETVSTGNFSVQVRAAGGTTTAPGAVLYEKHFNTPVYFPTGNTGAYIHFAFDSNAPIITAGSDYWITIKAPLGIQYPGAVQNTGFTAGRSFYEGNPDTTTWTPLVITTERAWIMRSVTIPYSAPELSGDYIIPKGANPKGFPSLAAAIDSLNKAGLTGTVRFLIDANLNETGANVRIYRPDLSAANNLIIKPNTGKTPTVTFTGCSTSGEAAYSGFTIDSSGFITIDGSNTASGTSRDMTFAMADSVNGRIVIQLYENTDNITIKNLNISYTATPASSTSSRGIYANGLIGGVADSVIIQNCKIGDGIQNPNYAVSITGYSTGTLYASKIYIRNNLLYGRMRTVYFYYGGKTGTTSEISGNELITNIAPPDANVLWGILFNTYGGTFNIFNNKIQTLKMASTGTQGIYGFGTLTGQTGTVLNIYNNFIGGDVDHTGTGATASIDMISFQDLATGTANIYHNTIVLNSLTKTATGRMTAIRLAGTWNKYVKNNIFVNNKSGSAIAYCILMGDTTGIIDFNNNAYYVADTANANIGYWKSANKTLANWQAASQQDALSFVENPVFTSSTNFHIPNGTTTFLESGGTPIAWITTDIDGQVRNSTTPDIGADEFAGIRPGVVVPDTATFTLSRLWNIIAVPLTAENMSKTSLFPTATSNAFWYQPGSGYVTQDTLAMGKGYWLKFDSAKTHTILGTTSTSKTFDVSTGWNLIGGLNANVPTTNVTTNPPGLVSSSFFGYSGAYYASTVLDRGRGYWVKTSGAGTMTVSLTTAKDAPEQDMFVETIEPSWKVINIADAFGREMNLYMANKVDENKFELPPVPPIGIFDARFQTQRYVESDGIAQRIDLNSAVYPVSITLRNSEKGFYRIKDAYNGSLLNIVVKDGQPITITNPAISSITIEGTTVPTQFQLMQNYPNPFNPTTLIRYALAEQVEVKLVVYNAVGERVKVLVQNEQEPGYYAVELNGADLASGIYFVRLETPKFTKTIKAMLLK
ncbi:MAG: T9SS type A sorting domain-containing protein, partial [Ignavibacteria bacterium]|nr:T9SS type A sorting domain-containing protein [Ignavibacteria bacterium]